MKRLLLTCLFSTVITLLWAKGFESFSVGGSVGYSNHSTIGGEGFAQMMLMKGKPVRFGIKAGFTYSPFEAQFQGVKNLKTESVGFFAEGDFYPFRKYLFLGVRWELINVNWFTNDALQMLESDNSSIIFTGTCLYGVLGVSIPVWRNIYTNIYAMPGIQQYRVSDGSFSSGNYVIDGTEQENHVQFSGRLLVGISVKLFSRP